MDQIVLYRPDNHNWPYMSEIRAAILFYTKRMYTNGRHLDYQFLKIETDIKRYEGDTLFTRNKIVLRKIELIFQNYHLNYESEYWQNIITELHTYLEPHSFLKEYRELFRRRFDIKYRKENQLMYVEKMLAKTEIGECAKKIVSFM